MSNESGARSPDAQLRRAQMMRKAAFAALAVIAAAAFCLVRPKLVTGGLASAGLLTLSLALIALGVTIRVWSAMYVAGRKSARLVAAGPYAVVRNPLYVGTLACVAGSALAFGSFVVTAILTVASFAILSWIIRQEEKRLLIEFGDDYRNYMASTPRWTPTGTPVDTDWMEVRVANVRRALVEALLFFAVIPAAAFVSAAHAHGWITPLLVLP